jgi:type I restriction-modification system DNA methylase subunit
MSLFQNSVLNKYLKGLESEKVNEAYERFTSHFHNPTIQENIRNSKEEQYQGEFLIDLFVNVFGYIKNPTPDFNLTTELKNIKGSKKTDGAILKGEKALAVIELKGTNTTDLSKVETQAFGYKNNQPGCNYVITSNFEKLRFYIDNAVDFEEFNLFQLTKERFEILCLCLSSEYLLKDIPKKIKDESLTQEENITKKLYKDYASFRNEIFDAIQNENPEYDKLTLFKKTQKLLDRFLFIFFAEDRLLLPPNSIRSIVNQWTDLKDKYDEYFPLYDRFKKYFGYMNTGHKGQQHDIFAYNGGLFAPDDILDNIKINDDLLYKHTVNLSNYDFESEVSVNILGHIFEHSLNDIDEIQAEIQGVSTEQNKTKRKKDGVFYTPKYITKYIVDNTVGKLCEEKKTELDIQEAEYEKERKGRQKATLKKLTQKLEDYRKWLLQITICDPACGSGAFLNQALEFLIKEHQYIDELQAKLFGDAMVLSEVENSILENNLFGVDINEESVEIAKLSLWLRTAQKGRKLTSLNNNIKCGNSLIDDPVVAGDNAFNWNIEFPEVFANGGFDLVIGNPPYVNLYNMDDNHRNYFDDSSDFPSTYLKYDLYVLFFDRGFSILKNNGHLSYIIPSVILSIPYGKNLRNKICSDYSIETIVDFTGFKVFADAMVESCILSIKKSKPTVNNIIQIKKPKLEIFDFNDNPKTIKQDIFLTTEGFQFRIDLDIPSIKIIDKIKKKSVTLESIYYVSKGIVAFSKVDKRKKEDFLHIDKINDKCHKYLEGRDVSRYLIEFDSKYLEYDKEIMSRPTFPELHLNPKIIIRAISGGINATYDKDSYFIDQKLIICSNRKLIEPFIASGKRPKTEILKDSESIDYWSTLGILNSKLSTFYYLKMLKGGVSVLPEDIRQFPIFPHSNKRESICLKVKEVLKRNLELNVVRQSLLSLLNSKFKIEKATKKLQNWHELDFGEFLKELEKARKKSAKENETEYNKFSLSDEAEWMQYFNEQKQKAEELKIEMNKTDREIDQTIYELYGLNQEEINIVEEATT